MPVLQVMDDETGVTYVIDLTEEDYVRASRDLIYCTELLAKAKATSLDQNNAAEKEANANANDTYNDGFRWVDGATKLLLTVYKEQEDLLHTGKLSVKKFWEIISEKLTKKKYDVTGPQCKSKFHGLKKTYKSVKDHNNKSGNNRRTWPYFEIMDEMFGHKPWATPVLTLDSSNVASLNSPACSSSSSGTTSPSLQSSSLSACTHERSRKRRNAIEETTLEKFVRIAQENKEEKRKMYEDYAARQERLLHILENIANKR